MAAGLFRCHHLRPDSSAAPTATALPAPSTASTRPPTVPSGTTTTEPVTTPHADAAGVDHARLDRTDEHDDHDDHDDGGANRHPSRDRRRAHAAARVGTRRVTIPALGVDGPVLPAGVNSEHELDVPPDARSLVWYRHGPAPGERGSAVIAGHLNWKGVTGLFTELAEIPIGAEITVLFDDGAQRSFRVINVELVPKPAVSVNGVFARDGARVLRLVTCGGEFDDDVNSYRSNVVVTAVPA